MLTYSSSTNFPRSRPPSSPGCCPTPGSIPGCAEPAPGALPAPRMGSQPRDTPTARSGSRRGGEWGEFPEVSPSPEGTWSFTLYCVHFLRGVLTGWERARGGTCCLLSPQPWGSGGVRRGRPALGFVTRAWEVPQSNLCTKRSRRKRFHFPGVSV